MTARQRTLHRAVFFTSFVTSQGLFLTKACAAACDSLPVLIAGSAAQDKLVQGLPLGAAK